LTERKRAEITLFVSFLFSTLIGTLFHFAFEISGGNTVVGAFTPVNESIWEHLKLILVPSIIAGAFEYFLIGKGNEKYFGAKCYGTILGMLFVLVGYYTYSGIIGTDYFVADIILFIVGMAIAAYSTYKILASDKLTDRDSIIGILVITALVILFMYFTFNPPMIELFRDPLSEDFGITS
jgi:hypothetical protein